MAKRPKRQTPRPRARVFLATAVAAALVGGASAYATAASSASKSKGLARAGLAALPANPQASPLRDAYGLRHARPQRLARLGNGDRLSVVKDARARCLLRSDAGRPAGEVCVRRQRTAHAPLAHAADLSEGSGIAVYDECGTRGENRMQIVGLAPEGTAKVRLLISDSSTETTNVHEGAFTFEGTNPGPEDPYPTGVEWLSSGAGSEGSAPLPVNGDEFCLPAEEPEAP